MAALRRPGLQTTLTPRRRLLPDSEGRIAAAAAWTSGFSATGACSGKLKPAAVAASTTNSPPRSTARPGSRSPPNRLCRVGQRLRMLPPQGCGPLGCGQRDDDPPAQQPGARKRKGLLSKILVARLLVELAELLFDRLAGRLLLQRRLQHVERRVKRDPSS